MSVRLIGVVGGGGGGGSGDISGTGIVGQVAEFVTDTKTIQAANLIAPANVLTLVAGAAYTLTIPKTGTPLIAGDNLSDVTTRQTAVNNLTAVSVATNEHVLTKDTATGNAVFKAAAGGGGTPGGADTQVQFNDGGSFGGDAGLVYNKTNDTLTIAGADAVRMILNANAAQTANILSIRKSDGTVWAGFDSLGRYFCYIGTQTSNIFIGPNSGNATMSGGYNTFMGGNAGKLTTTGNNNYGLGYDALAKNTIGSGNVAVGSSALANTNPLAGASNNVAIGYASLYSLTTGYYNTSVGYQTGYGIQTGKYNVYLGMYAGGQGGVNSHDKNVLIGYAAGTSMTTGGSNIIIGHQAGYRQTTNSNLLIVDNQIRADVATEVTNAILYGVMASAPANQTLRINAYVGINATPTTAGITLAEANNIVAGTTTGSMIGTAAAQKLGFYGATPVIQRAKASYNNWAAFTDVVNALVALGLFDAA